MARCGFLTANGEPCRAHKRKGRDRCVIHDQTADSQEAMRSGRKSGGSNKRPARPELQPIREFRVSSPEEMDEVLVVVANELLNSGEDPTAIAHAIVAVFRCKLDLRKVGTFTDRLDRMELLLKAEQAWRKNSQRDAGQNGAAAPFPPSRFEEGTDGEAQNGATADEK
jgi:hypothetical protein